MDLRKGKLQYGIHQCREHCMKSPGSNMDLGDMRMRHISAECCHSVVGQCVSQASIAACKGENAS